LVHARHAPHPLLGVELPQSLEVEVPEALVPSPSLVITTSRKAERLRHLDVEDVEVVAPPGHPGQKVLLLIPNTKHSVLDLHARTTHIQPPKADDRVAQRGDVEDLGEESVLASLGDEDDRADALDVDAWSRRT
jgi:hypothetical protein